MNTIPDKPEATDGDRVCANTDRELFREAPGDYYAHSLHVTAGGQIGINVGGLVFVKTLKAWHSLAIQTEDYVAARLAAVEAERDALFKINVDLARLLDVEKNAESERDALKRLLTDSVCRIQETDGESLLVKRIMEAL